ncbi:MAG: hypothetical protein ACRDRZ_10580 [Pseudonocardiaceae bacterium]
MSDWMWVTLGYGVAYGSLAGYLAVLLRRWVNVRRSTGEGS